MNQATKWAWEAHLGISRSESPQGQRAGASESNKQLEDLVKSRINLLMPQGTRPNLRLAESMLGGIARLAKRKLKVGDKIRVIGYRPGKYSPGVVDDMGTEELFKSLVGRRYTIRGFDDYGHIELRPKRLHTVWIEPDLVKLVRKTHAA